MKIFISFLIFFVSSQITYHYNGLSIGESYTGIIQPKKKNFQLFFLSISEKIEGVDLIVMVKGLNPNSDPNTYISAKNPSPLSSESAEVLVCEAIGSDVCILKYSHFVLQTFFQIYEVHKNLTTIYMGVVSLQPISYKVRVDYDLELKLFKNDFLSFIMKKEVQVIDFQVGNDQKNVEIEVNVEVGNLEEMEEPFFVYMNKKENGVPSNAQYDYQGKETFNKMKVIELKEKLPSEDYLILIYAQQGAKIFITSIINEGIKNLPPYKEVYQVVEKGDLDIYKIDNDDNQHSDCNFSLTFVPFQGSARIYINLNTQPPLLDNYEWQYANKNGYQILIQNKIIVDKKKQLEKYYIAVYGEEYCSYYLSWDCFYDEDRFFMKPRVIYYQNQNSQNIQTFLISDKAKYLQLEIKIHLGKFDIFTLNNYDGAYYYHDVDTSLKKLFLSNQSNSSDNNGFYVEKEQDFEIKLACGFPYCDWTIYVQLIEFKQVGLYSLKYEKYGTENYKLQENTPHKSFVETNSSQYFSFQLAKNDNIYQVSFILTPIEGLATLFVSTLNEQPDENNYEFKAIDNQISLQLSQNNSLKFDNFYLNVYGNRQCKFTITVWVTRSSQEDTFQIDLHPWNYIQLLEGVPQEHSLSTQQNGWFKVDLKNYEKELTQSIVLDIQQIYGNVVIFGYDRPDIDADKFKWKGNNSLDLDGHETLLPEILYLRVQLKYEHEQQYARYRIIYRYKYKSVELFQGNQYFAFIKKDEVQNFYHNFKEQKKIIITKKSEEYNSNQLNFVFDYFKYHYLDIKYSVSNNSVQISPDAIKEYEFKADIDQIQFSIQGLSDQFYSLIISNIDSNEIMLVEDKPLTKSIPIVDDKLYFLAKTGDLTIILFSQETQMRFFATLSYAQNFFIHYPSFQNYQKISRNHTILYQYSIYFSKAEFQQYSELPIWKVLLTVESQEPLNENDSLKEYTIQFHQNYTLLYPEQSQQGFIKMQEYRYYKFSITEQDSTNLMILLNPINFCDANLYVSKTQLPTQDFNDWNSENYLGDTMIIQAGNKVYPNMTGEYFLGVFGFDDCEFIIEFRTGEFQIYNIQFNTPITLYIQKNELIYFVQEKVMNLSFLEIFLESTSNTAKFFVDETVYLNKSNLKSNVTQFIHNNDDQGYLGYAKIFPTLQDNNSNFIIGIKAQKSEFVTIQTNLDNQQQIIMEKDLIYSFLIEANEKKGFSFYPESQILLNIQIIIGQIEGSYQIKNESSSNKQELNFEGKKNQYSFEIICQTQATIMLEIIAITQAYIKVWYNYNGENQSTKIKSAYPYFFSLRPQNKQKFIYESLKEKYNLSENLVLITLSQTFLNQQLQNQLKISKPIILVQSKKTNQELSYILEQQDINTYYKEYLDNENEYLISIINNGTSDQNYEIQVSTSQLRPLIPSFKSFASIELYETIYFYYWHPLLMEKTQKKYLYYEMQFCNGLFQVLLGKNLDNLQGGIYQTQIEVNQSKIQHGFIDLNYQDLYLKFQVYKLFQRKLKGQFTLKVYEVENKEEIPFENISLGDQGVLWHSIDEQNEFVNLVVNCTALNYSKLQNSKYQFEVEFVQYILLLKLIETSNSKDIDVCFEPLNEVNQISLQNVTQENITFVQQIKRNSNNSENLAFTILAKVNIKYSERKQIILDYYYESSNIKLSEIKQIISIQDSQYSFFFMLIIIFILLVVIASIIILKLKLKQKRQQLEFNESLPSPGIELQQKLN